MSKHLSRDLDALKQRILQMGRMVEVATDLAFSVISERKPEAAQRVIDGDRRVDLWEVETEEECLKILALHQPVAADLRFIVAVMKVNNDLERMGDLAVNIAERATYLASHDPIEVPLDFARMGDATRKMLRDSLRALIEQDTALARTVLAADDEVDRINAEMFNALQTLMREKPETIKSAMHTISVSRHLERIADLATNIAEDVVFMVEGEIIRHRTEDYLADRYE